MTSKDRDTQDLLPPDDADGLPLLPREASPPPLDDALHLLQADPGHSLADPGLARLAEEDVEIVMVAIEHGGAARLEPEEDLGLGLGNAGKRRMQADLRVRIELQREQEIGCIGSGQPVHQPRGGGVASITCETSSRYPSDGSAGCWASIDRRSGRRLEASTTKLR